MSDLIENVQDVFKKWESRGASNFNSRGRRGHSRGLDRSSYEASTENFANYSRFSDRKYKQRVRTPYSKVPKYDGLAQFKIAPTVMAVNKPRPFMGRCCSKCLPLSNAFVSDTRVFSLSVCNILHIPHFQSLDFRLAFDVLRKKQKPTYPDVSTNVLKSNGVTDTFKDIVDDSIEELEDCSDTSISNIKLEQFNRAKNLLELMKASISSVCLQISSLFIHSILSRVFDGVLVHKGQLEILKTANQENMPIVYLPLCQSQFDSVIISYILFVNSLKVPLIPLDQDLYIPLLRHLLKFLGAFFIRNHIIRKHSPDVLYSSVLQNYIIESLKAEQSLQIFLKDFQFSNKTSLTKSDLLSIVIESVLKGDVEDAYVSTVSISHEKFPERNFVNEQLGCPKEKSSLFSFLYSLWTIMHAKYGSIRLNFGQPFSIKEYIQSCNYNHSSRILSADTPPSSPTDDKSRSIQEDLENEQISHAALSLVKHTTYDATFSTSLMSTHLLAFLLVTQYRKGATQQQLQNSMDWLREQLANKKRDTGFTGQSLSVIKRAVELLGKDLISTEVVDMEWTSSDLENNNVKVTIYKPVIKLPHILELQHYSKYVVPVFLLDSIVANAIYALVDVEICHFRHCDSQLYVSRNKLIDKAVELCDILQFEFTFIPPCADLTVSFNESVDELIENECLHLACINITSGRGYSRKPHSLNFDASDDEEDIGDTAILKSQQLKVDLKEESINQLEFLRNVLSPIIESYWLSACTLLKLIDEVKEENIFIQEMQMTAQEKLYKGLLAYEESFSAAIFRNSLKLFENWHIVESYEQDGMKIVYLNENFNNKDKINETISKIEEFRK